MKPETIWFLGDAELPIRVKRIIASEKRVLIVFWGIHGIADYCWLPKDSTLDSPFFCEEVLSPLAQTMQRIPKESQNPWSKSQFRWLKVVRPLGAYPHADVS
jgi:hypothetical protein